MLGETPSKTPDGPPGPDGAPSDPLAKLRGASGVGKLGPAGKYAGLGIQFALSILLFLWVGQWVDKKLGSEPLFLFVGVFSGAAAAFYAMYRTLMADQRRDERGKKR